MKCAFDHDETLDARRRRVPALALFAEHLTRLRWLEDNLIHDEGGGTSRVDADRDGIVELRRGGSAVVSPSRGKRQGRMSFPDGSRLPAMLHPLAHRMLHLVGNPILHGHAFGFAVPRGLRSLCVVLRVERGVILSCSEERCVLRLRPHPDRRRSLLLCR